MAHYRLSEVDDDGQELEMLLEFYGSAAGEVVHPSTGASQ
jgi:hypothetical protein